MSPTHPFRFSTSTNDVIRTSCSSSSDVISALGLFEIGPGPRGEISAPPPQHSQSEKDLVYSLVSYDELRGFVGIPGKERNRAL